eukprot:m.178752 g.178752  ORF g.178752 m.178752 type:complete len:342 (-) comp14613_c0_seq1:1020-2045(-)
MIVLALAIVCPLVAIGTSLVVVRARRSAGTTTTTRPLGESYVGCSILSTGVASTKHRMRLKKHGDVPAVMQRAGILTAYRYGLSNTECIKSCVTVTNELANQWTHGLPLLWASWTAYLEVCKFVAGSLTEIELGVSMAYFLLVILCLGSSFVYHTFGCRSAEHCWDLCHVDHIGVVLGTLASYFPALYYGYTCDPELQLGYASVAGVVFLSVLTLMRSPNWRHDDWFPIRLTSLGSLIILGLVPSAHYIVLHWHSPDLDKFVRMVVECYSILCIGIAFYLTRFPESMFPGTFDLMFYSHMWWHLMVAGGFFAMYHSWTDFRDYRNTVGCAVPSNESAILLT